MGVMGVPPSVLRSRPVSVCTSKMGFCMLKKPGLPHPVTTCRFHEYSWSSNCCQDAQHSVMLRMMTANMSRQRVNVPMLDMSVQPVSRTA